MNYEFHPEAEQEFIEEAAWYESAVQGLGVRFGAEVDRVIELLLENPDCGTPVDVSRMIRNWRAVEDDRP